MWKPHATLLFLGAAAVGCSDPQAPVVVEPAAMEIVLGEGQYGEVGQRLALPLLVRVTDDYGHGFSGADVDFTVTSGVAVMDGAWEACGYQNWGNPERTVSHATDRDGYAWVVLTPATFGTTTVEATVNNTSLDPAIFSFDVNSPDVTIEITPYEEQIVAGWHHIQSLEIHVTDELGDPVWGVPIKWELTSGAGDLDDYGPSCAHEEPAEGVLITRTALARDGWGREAFSELGFKATTFGISTLSASVMGSGTAPAVFTLDATVLEIVLEPGTQGPAFYGPNRAPDVEVPVGATVEWEVRLVAGGHITSTSAPAGGTPFDSGDLSHFDRFQFVPDVAGTWRYVDEVSGAEGTLTAR